MKSHTDPSPRSKETVSPSLKILGAIFLLAAIVCSFNFPTIYGPNIDDSLHWAYNYFADGHFPLAARLAFPHGPLAFLVYPVLMGNNYIVAYIAYCVFSALMSFYLLRISLRINTGNFVPALLAVAGLLVFADLQMVIACLVVSLVLIHHLTGRNRYLLAFAALSVLNLLIKPYGGIICGTITGLHILLTAFHEKDPGPVIRFLSACLLFYFIGWMSLFGKFDGAFEFLSAQMELALHNSEEVQFNDEHNILFPVLSVLFTLCLFFTVKEKLARHLLLLMILPLYAAWKHAMARADVWHLEGLLEFFIFLGIVLFLVHEKRNFAAYGLSLLSIGCFTLYLYSKTDYFQRKEYSFFRPSVFYSTAFEYEDLKKKNDEENKYVCRNESLPDSVKNLIGKSTVDVYPWNYAIIAANNLNWKPRPVLNSYAAYTSRLDQRDAAFYDSDDSPEFVIWHFTDPNDRGWQFESIDNRHILNDEPKALCRFLANYRPVVKNTKLILYKKRGTALSVNTADLGGKMRIKWDQWIDVPPGADDITRVRLKWEKTFLGSLKGVLYKGEICYIFYELQNGHVFSNRLVPGNSESGIWVSPLPLLPSYKGSGELVKRIKFLCLNPSIMKDELTVQFETLKFSEAGKTYNVPDLFMGETGARNNVLFYSLNTAESMTHPELYIDNHSEAETWDYMSPPSAYRIQIGKTSGFMTIPSDSLAGLRQAKSCRLQFEGVVKCEADTKARFAITSSTLANSPAIWEKPLIEITNKSEAWTYISFYVDIPSAELSKKGRLYYSLSNTGGRRQVLLDDLGITITALSD